MLNFDVPFAKAAANFDAKMREHYSQIGTSPIQLCNALSNKAILSVFLSI